METDWYLLVPDNYGNRRRTPPPLLDDFSSSPLTSINPEPHPKGRRHYYRAIRDRSCECAAVCEKRAGYNIHGLLHTKKFAFFVISYAIFQYPLHATQKCSA